VSVSAATAGSTAGFRLAAPSTWLLTPGLDSYLRPPHGGLRLDVNMAPFIYQWPVKEARYLQQTAIATRQYHDYHLISILAILFHGNAAANWTFWWKPRYALYRIDVTEIIFTAKTSAGPQSYILSMTAPAQHASWASHVMLIAMRTFAPLP
jgi:hypothetical protein